MRHRLMGPLSPTLYNVMSRYVDVVGRASRLHANSRVFDQLFPKTYAPV